MDDKSGSMERMSPAGILIVEDSPTQVEELKCIFEKNMGGLFTASNSVNGAEFRIEV